MEENNIYAAPQAEVLDEANINYNLASRGQRFVGSFVDGLVIGSITIPLMYFTGGIDGIREGQQPSLVYTAVMTLIGFVLFLGINYKFLKNDGQTIGKKVAKTKIITNEGEPASFGGHIIKRYALYNFLGMIPVAGQILSMINILIIFGSAKRCGHDYFAGTKVVAV
jgi:uncharacterized RDD family membrane protein YckC